MAKHGDDTPQKAGLKEPWRAGQSGNPTGRPKGARSKLSESFLDDLYESWERHGAAAIMRVIDEKPDAYLKVVASLLPKNLNLNVNPYNDLTDEQIDQRIRELDAQLRRGSQDLARRGH
jgi:hypothetical protein